MRKAKHKRIVHRQRHAWKAQIKRERKLQRQLKNMGVFPDDKQYY